MSEPYQVPEELVNLAQYADAAYASTKRPDGGGWRRVPDAQVRRLLAAVLPRQEAAVRADERAKLTAPQDEYVDISYGPWEASGHQCDDLVPGGCDEPVPSRQVFVHTLRGKQLFGPQLGDCPNRCTPRPAGGEAT